MKKRMSLEKLFKDRMSAVYAGYVVSGDDKNCCCGCGCYYAGTPGGSSTDQNSAANYDGKLASPLPGQ